LIVQDGTRDGDRSHAPWPIATAFPKGIKRWFFTQGGSHMSMRSRLPYNEFDWKHLCVFDDYTSHLMHLLDKRSMQLLQHLADGRPLRGQQLDGDGCLFAWLTSGEVKELATALSSIDGETLGRDMPEFHECLEDSLDVVSRDGHALLLIAM
jgi:hypothetical protein